MSGAAAPLEIWWVKAVPLEKAPASGKPSWADVADGTLVGAIRVGAAWTDIRGHGMKPGVYTLRYGQQPQDGNHVGTSDFSADDQARFFWKNAVSFYRLSVG